MSNLLTVLLPILTFAIACSLASPIGSPEKEEAEEVPKPKGSRVFTFVDATNPAGWKEGHRVQLEKVRLVGSGGNTGVPVEIWLLGARERARTAAKFELMWYYVPIEKCPSRAEFEQMAFEVAYTDLQGAHQEVRVKISEQEEEVRDAIYNGRRTFRMEKQSDGSATISIFWGSEPGALDVHIVEENNTGNAHAAKLQLEHVSVTQGQRGACDAVPIKEGKYGPQFHLDWKHHCHINHTGEPEQLRNVEIRLEYSHEHDKSGGKKHAVVQLEKYPYKQLAELYEGNKARITVNAHNGHAVMEPFVEKSVDSTPSCAKPVKK